jgi:hypothetical protein
MTLNILFDFMQVLNSKRKHPTRNEYFPMHILLLRLRFAWCALMPVSAVSQAPGRSRWGLHHLCHRRRRSLCLPPSNSVMKDLIALMQPGRGKSPNRGWRKGFLDDFSKRWPSLRVPSANRPMGRGREMGAAQEP